MSVSVGFNYCDKTDACRKVGTNLPGVMAESRQIYDGLGRTQEKIASLSLLLIINRQMAKSLRQRKFFFCFL